MKKMMALFALVAMTGLFAVACGGADNVGACEDYIAHVEGLECLPDGYDSGFSCDTYDGIDCDYTEYFTCLTDGITCDGDTISNEIGDCSVTC